MIEVACATGGNHRDVDCSGDGFKEWEVVAITGAITVHAGEQDLPCTPASCFGGPGDDVETAGAPTAVRVDPPAAATRLVASVDGDDDALATKDVRSGVDELGIIDGRGIDRNLVGAGREQISNVAHGANPAPNGQRDENLVGGALDDVDHRAAAVGGRRDVEEHQFVCAFAVVERGQLNGITSIAQVDKLDAFDDAATSHVETGDNPAVRPGNGEPVADVDGVRTQHGAWVRPNCLIASARSTRPSYNARPMIAPAAPAAATASMSSSDAMPPEAMTSASIVSTSSPSPSRF